MVLCVTETFCNCWNETDYKFKIPNPGSLKIMKSFNSVCYRFRIGLVNILKMWFGSYSIYNPIIYFFCCKLFWALHFRIGLVNILKIWFGSFSIYNIIYFFCCKMFWALHCKIMNLVSLFCFLVFVNVDTIVEKIDHKFAD